MSILCVIPVRGGSKGVPGKNGRLIAGKPLVAWTIEQALAAEADLEVVVSTDDERLADIAREAGATVPFLRPAELAGDTTPTEPVIVHAIEWAQSRPGHRTPEAVMLLQATSPVRLPGTIDRAVAQFRASASDAGTYGDGEIDALVGVVPVSPFLWRMGERSTGPAHPEYDVTNRPRRQELRPNDIPYYENGSLYLSKPECYLEHGNRLAGRVGMFVMDELEGVDVDTELDFSIAEATLLHTLARPHTEHTLSTPEDVE